MTEFTFARATKEQAKLRLAIFGPSGSGKTFTALRLATGLGGNIAFIDTERGSASMYADRFSFDVLELTDKDINTYCTAIRAAQKASYAVLIIDSLTHAWQELLQEVDKLARAKYRGNTWAAWSEGTPKQRKLVDVILDYDGHIIATMRTKTEWTTESTSGNKTKPIRVGLAPMQGKGIEYEFDLLLEINPEHIANCIKDRTGKYQDKIIEMPGEELGQELAAWLKEGIAPRPKAKTESTEPATPKLHWADKEIQGEMVWDRYTAFLAKQNLTEEAALQILGVKDIYDYKGNMESAVYALKARKRVPQNTPNPQWDDLLLATIVEKQYAQNVFNARGMLKLSKELTHKTEFDVVLGWCEQYRSKRDANIGSGISAEEADMWLKDAEAEAEEKAPAPGTPITKDEDIPF